MAFDNCDMQAVMNLKGPQYKPFISATVVVPEPDHPHPRKSRLSPCSGWTPLEDPTVEDVRDGLIRDDTRQIYDGHVMNLFGSACRSAASRRGGDETCMEAKLRKISVLARLFWCTEGCCLILAQISS